MKPSAGALCASRFRSCEINPKIIKKSAPPQQKNFPRGPHPLLTLRLLSRLFFSSGPEASAEAFVAKAAPRLSLFASPRLRRRLRPSRAFCCGLLICPGPELQLRWRRLLRGKAASPPGRLSAAALGRVIRRARRIKGSGKDFFVQAPKLQPRPSRQKRRLG